MLGHRSLKMYYDQRLRPATVSSSKEDAIAAKVRQVRLNLADPTQALVPVAGGHGAYGRGLQVMKARNAGEAKWAKRQASNFKDIRVRENHKTRIGYVHNNQKREQSTHPRWAQANNVLDFRDPLCQSSNLTSHHFCLANDQCNDLSWLRSEYGVVARSCIQYTLCKKVKT